MNLLKQIWVNLSKSEKIVSFVVQEWAEQIRDRMKPTRCFLRICFVFKSANSRGYTFLVISILHPDSKPHFSSYLLINTEETTDTELRCSRLTVSLFSTTMDAFEAVSRLLPSHAGQTVSQNAVSRFDGCVQRLSTVLFHQCSTYSHF
jgi:hypothetical protein